MSRTIAERRSVTKALTYRAAIMCFDFITIYLLTGTLKMAVGFMIISNTYTTVAYFIHQRIWARVTWGVRQT
jgi:uncharacterized membrane protein